MTSTKYTFRAWLTDVTPEEAQWLRRITLLMRAPRESDGTEHERSIALEIISLCVWTMHDPRVDIEFDDATGNILFASEGERDPVPVGALVSAFYQEFRNDDSPAFELHFSISDGPDHERDIAGGVVVVTHARAWVATTYDLAAVLLESEMFVVDVEHGDVHTSRLFRSRIRAEHYAINAAREALAADGPMGPGEELIPEHAPWVDVESALERRRARNGKPIPVIAIQTLPVEAEDTYGALAIRSAKGLR